MASTYADSNAEICSKALILIGIPAISSLDDSDDVSVTCNEIYETEIHALLSKYDWRFAAKKVQLSENTEVTPVGEWPTAYSLPGDMIGAISHIFDTDADDAAPYKKFEIFGEDIYTDVDAVYVDYTARVSEEKWPAYFTVFVIAHLAEMLAEILTDDTEKAERMHRRAYGMPGEGGMGGLYREARRQDSQQHPPAAIQDYTLVDARRGAYG